MPELVKCALIIEERCKEKGTVIAIPKEILLAVKHYLHLFKGICEDIQNLTYTDIEFYLDGDEELMASIKAIAKEEW